MRGSIRFILGMLITLGAVGGIEAESATMLQGVVAAVVGLAIMYSGVLAFERNV
jgi:hypothetical protein